MHKVDFTCNICAHQVRNCPAERIDREVVSCDNCGSTVRIRSIIHLLSVALYGRSLELPDWPANKQILGIGLSDWEGYAKRLEVKVSYKNTYFHKEPFMDITSIKESEEGKYDFVISSDVFEHVAPPVSRAFINSRKLLKMGGHLILTVPYGNGPDTVEHFGRLFLYKTIEIDGDYVLVNKTKSGSFELYQDLNFHGGPGQTLEMRAFCRSDVARHLHESGFQKIMFFSNSVEKFGIRHNYPWSLPILAGVAANPSTPTS